MRSQTAVKIGVETGSQGSQTDRDHAPVSACGGGPAQAPAPPPPADDQRLVSDALAGDTAAFGCLVAAYQDRLFNSLVRFTGSEEDARDIAQEAFIQAFVKLKSFQHNSAFYTWLYRIAMNRAISHARKRRERTSLDRLSESGAPAPLDRHELPDATMLADERAHLVRQAVAELADDQRQVVVLREFEGFDYQQIAEVLEIPLGTVRSRLFRARMQMKERLAPILLEQTPPSSA